VTLRIWAKEWCEHPKCRSKQAADLIALANTLPHRAEGLLEIAARVNTRRVPCLEDPREQV
jgi:hypothetical protein